ncbi:YwqG family protein [Rothia sp. P3C3.S176]|uniref:YwqG family protein n=1 Tax=Rothia sp. P3C3.S176 TaxID=2962204 RepID=UPI0020C90697|nr:YwqG family protein [Rothia sp. P3C3.S176]MCP8996356.1 YwqG family protein [Rothia sp. P3C3.S176]
MFDNKPFEDIEKQAKHVIDLLNQEGARKKAIALKPFVPAEPLPQTASKFGGRPYLPAGELPPTNEKGEPLGMIAQINCAELPENDIYPATGMLQFWINPNDEECLWGFDYENPLSQKNHRVVYYETLGEPNPDAPFPTVDWDEGGWPIGGFDCESGPLEIEYGMTFEVREQGVTASGYDYYDVFGAKWDETYPDELLPEAHENPYKNQPRREALYELTEPFESEEEYSHVGGYPFFVQNDPRDEFEELRGHTVNLLTIVSESENEENEDEEIEIMWGDAGAANWLITPEALAARDFSQVVFEWACG